jgi:antitoxin (DNA-binding transcriptional repressor) of toxin-antitoxin stability system
LSHLIVVALKAAHSTLAQLVAGVEHRGETVVLTRYGVPVAHIVPVPRVAPGAAPKAKKAAPLSPLPATSLGAQALEELAATLRADRLTHQAALVDEDQLAADTFEWVDDEGGT